MTGGIEPSAQEEGGGDDGGKGFGDGRNLEQQEGDEDGEKRPKGVGGSPQLLGKKGAVDGRDKDEGEEGVEVGVGAEVLRAEIVEGEYGREDEEVWPEGEELLGAVGRVVGVSEEE